MGQRGPTLTIELGSLQVLEDLLGAEDHRGRQTREPCDLDAEGAVGTTWFDLPEEDDALLPFLGRDMEVPYPGDVGRQFSQLVVVGGEEGPRAPAPGDVLRDGPRDREAVEGGG